MVSEGSNKIFGVITNARIGIKKQYKRQYLIKFQGIETKKAASLLIGRKVQWQGDVTIRGKVVSPHGNNGVVRVRFKRGLPGWAIGTKVILLPS